MDVFILCTVVRRSAILHRDVIHCPSVYLTSAGCSQEEGNPCLCRCRQSLSDSFEEATAISICSLFKTWLSRRGGLRVSAYLGKKTNDQTGWLRKAEVKDGGGKPNNLSLRLSFNSLLLLLGWDGQGFLWWSVRWKRCFAYKLCSKFIHLCSSLVYTTTTDVFLFVLSAGSCRSSSCEGSPCARSSTPSSSPPAGSPAPNTTTLLITAAPAARRRTSLSSGTTRWVVPDRWQRMDLDSLFCSFLVLPVKSSLVQSHLKPLFVFLQLQVDCWYTELCKQKSRDRTGSFLLNIEYSGSTLSHEIGHFSRQRNENKVVLANDCWLYVGYFIILIKRQAYLVCKVSAHKWSYVVEPVSRCLI